MDRIRRAPEIVNGRTMVPVRAIAEALGYKVGFDESTRTVQLVKDAVTIELYVGRTGIRRMEQGKGPVMKPTDTEPYIKQDLTYVPVRFFAEETGLDVQWNDANRTVILRKKTSASS
ncbi:copper amine oxidase N-terminal domain-containing protein [Paenibacillus sp. P26]|nr:copper amine oxidase N-terminal domain-containing protein [Paenibacillus sp. P26]